MFGEYMGKPFRYWYDLEKEHTILKEEYEAIIKYPQVQKILVLHRLAKQAVELQEDIKTTETRLEIFHKKLTEITTNG